MVGHSWETQQPNRLHSLNLAKLYLHVRDHSHSFSKAILKMHSYIPQGTEECMVPQPPHPFRGYVIPYIIKTINTEVYLKRANTRGKKSYTFVVVIIYYCVTFFLLPFYQDFVD